MLDTLASPAPGASAAQPPGPVVVGVDTHKDVHHAAVLTLTGQLLADRGFPTTTAGYQALLDWAAGIGRIESVGVELTGSYGAALTRHLQAAGITVWEVNTTDRAARARRGKDDRLDAIAAGQKVLSGMATATPKDTTGEVESLRMLLLTRRSAIADRTRALNQVRDLLVTAPAILREQLTGIRGTQSRLKAIHALAVTGRPGNPMRTAITSLQRLAARIGHLDTEIDATTRELTELVTPLAPNLLAERQVGPMTAAQLLVTAAQNADRIHSEAAFARLTGIAPIPVSSGKTDQMRLHRGGDRAANSAIYMVAVGRLRTDPASRAYLAKRLGPHPEKKSKKPAIRMLKRYIARQLYRALINDLTRT